MARFGFMFMLGWLLTLAVGLGGCSSTPKVLIFAESMAAPGADAYRSFVVEPAHAGINPTSQEYFAATAFVVQALSLDGFTRADSASSAEIVVKVDYEVGEPIVLNQTYTIPHWGQTGTQSVSTTGTATSTGTFQSFSNGTQYNGTTNFNTTTTQQPTYGVTGYSTGVSQSVEYVKSLELTAVTPASSGLSRDRWVEQWRVGTAIRTPGSDIRYAFPFLVAGMRPHFAKSTASIQRSYLAYDDASVLELRGLQR